MLSSVSSVMPSPSSRPPPCACHAAVRALASCPRIYETGSRFRSFDLNRASKRDRYEGSTSHRLRAALGREWNSEGT